MGAYPWPIRIVLTRWGRLACALVMAGTIAALAHAAFERGRRERGDGYRPVEGERDRIAWLMGELDPEMVIRPPSLRA